MGSNECGLKCILQNITYLFSPIHNSIFYIYQWKTNLPHKYYLSLISRIMKRTRGTQSTCLLVWGLVAALLSQNLVFPAFSATFQDEKNFFYFPPYPGVVASPPVVIPTPPIVDPSPPLVPTPPIVDPSPPIGTYFRTPPYLYVQYNIYMRKRFIYSSNTSIRNCLLFCRLL